MTNQTIRSPEALAPGHLSFGFPRILCGINGSRGSIEAAHQAAILAGHTGMLSLLSVHDLQGQGLARQAALSAEHAAASVREVARDLECEAITAATSTGGSPADVLLERAVHYDLLALGAPPATRPGGILFGRASTQAVHRAPVPVLLARPAPEGNLFPGRIVLGLDGSPDSLRAVALAKSIRDAHDCPVTAVHVTGPADRARRHELAEEAADVATDLDIEPILTTTDGDVHDRLLQIARVEQASLIVVGSSAKTGIRALGSVSERVAHEAPCSVLIARPLAG